jgi:hypothetical protein
LIDNIIILKSFTPNLAGDFTGGWVDIQTKDFQSKEAMSISLGIGYNPSNEFEFKLFEPRIHKCRYS